MSTPADAPTLPPVDSFVQAMSQLMAFEQEFGPMQSALVVDGDGAVRDGVVLTADWHTADHALSYVLVGDRQPGEHVLLFSVIGAADIRVLAESDVDAYAALGRRCADEGLHLADWLIAGGEWYRSMQLTLANRPPGDWALLDGVGPVSAYQFGMLEAMTTEQIAVRLPVPLLGELDRLVAAGVYESRAAAVRAGIEMLAELAKRRRDDDAIIDGYAATTAVGCGGACG